MTAAPLDAAPVPGRYWLGIALCVALNALDGFDVLSISFAAPGIAQEWAVGRAALGFVLSYELIGMAAGSIVMGQLADRIGRRPATIACLVVMALGMGLTMRVTGLGQLAATRLFTGLGIGGMLAVTNALVAEYANARWRSACVAVMAAGYPMGAIAGGAAASHLLASAGWRSVFALGFGMTLALLPLVALLLPEPLAALLARPGQSARAQAACARLFPGHEAALVPTPRPARGGLAALFAPDLRGATLALTAAYFCHILTFYFILKWTPKIVADMGFAPSSAAQVLVWANVGGLAGGLAFSALSLGVGLRRLLGLFMLAAFALVAGFGRVQGADGLAGLSWAAAAGGFCTNGAMVGLYALTASAFPAPLRGTGTGLVIGVGRAGAALGPIIAGQLFGAGLGLPAVAGLMACGALLAAGLLQAPSLRRGAV